MLAATYFAQGRDAKEIEHLAAAYAIHKRLATIPFEGIACKLALLHLRAGGVENAVISHMTFLVSSGLMLRLGAGARASLATRECQHGAPALQKSQMRSLQVRQGGAYVTSPQMAPLGISRS